jgi:hypothetical protein
MNTFEIRTSTDNVFTEASLQMWGDYNAIDLYAGYNGQNFGAKFEPGSNNNILIYSIYAATTPIANYGSNNTLIPRGAASATGAGSTTIAHGSPGAAIFAGERVRESHNPKLVAPKASSPLDRDRRLVGLWIGRGEDKQTVSSAAVDAIFATNDVRFEPATRAHLIDEPGISREQLTRLLP